MIDTNRIINLINLVLKEIDELVRNNNFYQEDRDPIYSTKKVLSLLERELESCPQNINERVLRAMHDVGMSSYKDYENTTLEVAINSLTAELFNALPQYKHLKPLRTDFGKGNPI